MGTLGRVQEEFEGILTMFKNVIFRNSLYLGGFSCRSAQMDGWVWKKDLLEQYDSN